MLEGTGQFRQELEQIVSRAGTRLNVQVELSSLPLVAKAVASGAFAGVLPISAAGDLTGRGTHCFAPSPLRALRRDLLPAWNPRMVAVRPPLNRALALVQEAFVDKPGGDDT